MNKMKKLLSVLLAVLMILSSMTVMASAAKANYKTVDELEALDAYSPYGQVTRLDTETRMSIVFDALDQVLTTANINPGQLFNLAGLSLSVDLRSIDAICGTLDNVKSLLGNWLVGLLGGLLGIVGDLNFDNWDSGMTRDNTAQLYIVSELATALSDNKSVIAGIIEDGEVDLGLASSALSGLDLSIIADIPGLIKGMIYPMFERKDDTIEEVKNLKTYSEGDGNVESVINNFVKGLFTKPMSTTTLKVAEDGVTITSAHQGFLNAFGDTYRYKYTIDTEANPYTITSWIYTYDEEADSWSYVEEKTFTLTKEYPDLEDSDYVYTAEDGTNIKWYEDNSYWLQEQVAIDLSTMSAAELLYTFVPIVFEKMAPVVLNGSLKKILGGFLSASYSYVGDVGSDAVMALADYDAETTNIFTMEQGDYLWEWSYYEVINGNHYYRYEDQIFSCDTTRANKYFYMINWDYEITGDFMDEFVPENGGSTTDTLLMNLNDFLVKVATEVLDLDYINENKSADVPKVEFEKGSNAVLVQNIKELAQAVITIQPESIFGSDYADGYYKLLLEDDNQTILTGLAAIAVDGLMPQMLLPEADDLLAQGTAVGAILAAALRELATQLVPTKNYDALIYADYGTSTSDKVKTFLSGKDNSYWLDVILTMGVDIGMEYIRAFADMGEDEEAWKGVTSVGYADSKTWEANTTQATLNAYWEGVVDYIVDWALSSTVYGWKMEKMVNTTGLTIDLATAQDPWVKLDQILDSLLPIDEILNVTAPEDRTELEQLLRYDFILSLVNLEWENITALLQIPEGFIRTTNVLDSLAGVIKNLVNGLFVKVGGGSYALLPSSMTDFDSLANQANLATLVEGLLGALPAAYTNGLLDVVLPFINFILGWKTDPQVLAEPQITTSFRDDNDYAFQWTGQDNYPAIDADSTVINFFNNSSGMLEIHRGSTVEDHAYEIAIKEVYDDATINELTYTFSDGEGVASPYETVGIKIGGKYNGEEAVTITIGYEYVGKDGEPIGGRIYKSITVFFTNQYEDAQVWHDDGDTSDSTYRNSYQAYIFTEDIYNTVINAMGAITLKNSLAWSVTSNLNDWKMPDSYEGDADGDGCEDDTIYYSAPSYDEYGQSGYFTYRTQDESEWPSSITADALGSAVGNGYFFKEGTETPDEGEDYPMGIYAWPQVGVKYGSHTSTWNWVFIHYDDYDIYDIYTANKDRGITKYDVTDEDVYNEWNEAFKDIVKYATYPMMTAANSNSATDYVDVIMPKIPAAIERFEAANEALENALADANTSAGAESELPSYVQDLGDVLALDDGYGEKEVNYQDYRLYEYFSYADLRTEARNLMKTYYAPAVLDTYYILNSGISEEELNKVIANEETVNATKAAAITASRLENDPVAVADSIRANEEWEMPVYTELYIDDMAARVAYYRSFLTGTTINGTNQVVAANKEAVQTQFLAKEIAYADAQEYVEADYTAASWAAYASAYENAAAVLAGTAEYANYNSTVFAAKYALMVAEKNLLRKADSLIEAGGTADLLANIDIAESILAMSLDEIVLSDIATDKGLTVEEALGHLIQGLGYYYVGEDGNTWNLYADSAYEYADNDRPNRASNQAKVDACNDNLEACIAYFELAEELEPNTIALKEDAPFEAIIDTVNCGDYNGAIYGFDTLGWNDAFEVDGAIADFITTAYGDDYLEVVVGDAGVETTGTLINVLDENGEVVETYVYIYFGDVDMDGLVGASDAMICEYYEMMYEGIDTLYQFMAGDLDGDAIPGSGDAMVMEYWEMMYEGMPTQAEIAEMASCLEYEIF